MVTNSDPTPFLHLQGVPNETPPVKRVLDYSLSAAATQTSLFQKSPLSVDPPTFPRAPPPRPDVAIQQEQPALSKRLIYIDKEIVKFSDVPVGREETIKVRICNRDSRPHKVSYSVLVNSCPVICGLLLSLL